MDLAAVTFVCVMGAVLKLLIVVIVVVVRRGRNARVSREEWCSRNADAHKSKFAMREIDATLLVNFFCEVCLEELRETGTSVARLECGHHFHKRCVLSWLHRSGAPDCPSCRGRVRCEHAQHSADHVVIEVESEVESDAQEACTPREVPRAVICV